MLPQPDPATPATTLAVLPQQHEVMWQDGSAVQLHSVAQGSTPHPLLRALVVDGAWALLDLQRALPDVADDIRVQPRRPAHGLLFFALRGRWASAGAFVAHMRPHLLPLQPPRQAA